MKEQKKKLESLGVQPRDGQNFLVDEKVMEALVEAGEVEVQSVLEIGAGTGAVTGRLARRAKSVRALEIDSKLAAHLRERFEDVVVETTSFLETEVREDRCVSNIPFNITSEVVERLGEKQVMSALIVQNELAEKAVQEPGDSNYGRFTVLCRYYFVPVKLRRVPSSAFYPEPGVDAAILKLYPNSERHGVEDEEAFFEVTRALFTHKRKKVRNAFVDARHILGFEKSDAKKTRDELPHSEERVIDLEVRQIAEVAQSLRS